ncbi:uncharacterized protein [Antedon mediterranea]|uniref:uncharacterized protein n=1 Tax=Antedon mediterranea TaxID=105859 RepID=UPI003AF935F1
MNMNFNDLFRSIFGFSSKPNNHGLGDFIDDDEDNDFGSRDWGEDDGVFGDMHDQFFKETQEMFSHFQEMFSSFGFAEFPQIGLPEMEHDGSMPRSKSPRNEMLKSDEHSSDTYKGSRQNEDSRQGGSNWFSPSYKRPSFGDIFKIPSLDIGPHSNNGKKEDRDLDKHIDQSNLDLILPKERDETMPSMPGQKSFFRSISVRTIRRADGTTETHRTEKDSEGNVKKTISSTDDNGRPTDIIIDDKGQPLIQDNFQEIPPLKDKQSSSIFSKFFGSW